MLIAFTHIIVIDVEVCLFGNCYAGMTQDFTQSVNIHTIHQTTLGEIVTQTMGCVFFVQPRTGDVLAEVAFKVAHTDGATVFFDREKVITFHISVFELEPTPQGFFGFGGEEHSPFLPSLRFLRPQIDPLAGEFQIADQQGGTLTQPHPAVEHQQDHNIVPVFGEVGAVELGEQSAEFIVGQVDFGLSVGA